MSEYTTHEIKETLESLNISFIGTNNEEKKKAAEKLELLSNQLLS
jgi:hypothetical protein